MKHSVLFLSHAPHDTHRAFAEAVGARVHILPFKGLVDWMKRHPLVGHLYPFLSAFYALKMRVRERVLLIDGGSSLFVAAALKLKYRNLVLVYLDGDLLFYNLEIKNAYKKRWGLLFLKAIDAVISVSTENSKYVYLDVPKRVCAPYPKAVRAVPVKRENWGLYVGRLDPEKGITRILAFALQCPHLDTFMFLGDGVLQEQVRERAAHEKKLVYAGAREDVATYYSKCTFLIHIPDHDPHPTATMEAAQCGCFPIVSRGVGTSYLFDERFVVDDPEDFTHLNAKMERILAEKEESQMLLAKNTQRIPSKAESLRRFKDAFDEILKELNV